MPGYWVEIPDTVRRRVEALAARLGEAPERLAGELLGERLAEKEQETPYLPAADLLAFAQEVRDSIPAEDLARVPDDIVEELDHYLYGNPKRNGAP